MSKNARHSQIRLVYGCLLVITAMLCGCAIGPGGPSAEEVIRAIAPGTGAYIPGVPVIEQERRMCGPASLASVAGFYNAGTADGGADAEAARLIDGIAAAVYDEKLDGTLPMDLFIHARDMGFKAEYYGGGLDDLKQRISESAPLVLFLNLGTDAYAVGHYVVAVGYSDTHGVVVVHWGRDREETISYADLERSWSKTRHSTLLIRPEGER